MVFGSGSVCEINATNFDSLNEEKVGAQMRG